MLGVSIPLTIRLGRDSEVIGQTLGWPVFFWLAVSGLTLTALLAIDSLHLLRWLLGRAGVVERELDPGRRAFLRRVGGGSALLGASGTAAQGVVSALRTPPIVDIEIHLDRLPASLDGFVITQITDLHVGNTIGESFVRAVVDAANGTKADLVVLTGDLVDGSVEMLRDSIAPLADLQSTHGTYFVTGNHEYYSGVEPWIMHHQELGIRVLRNERVSIGNGDASFDLAGIDDHNADRWPNHGADLAKALLGRDASRELVLLAHQPRQVHQAAKYGVGLQLSGHTHGGQIWPWHYIASAQQGGLLAGHSLHDKTQLYVSRGTGYWGPPVRVFARSEITRVTLRAT